MTDNERLAVLEQRVKHIEEHTAKTATKVDEIHAVLMQARGVRWAIVSFAGLVGFLAGMSNWLFMRH